MEACYFSKVANFRLQLYYKQQSSMGVFLHFLNCTNGTKSCKASHMITFGSLFLDLRIVIQYVVILLMPVPLREVTSVNQGRVMLRNMVYLKQIVNFLVKMTCIQNREHYSLQFRPLFGNFFLFNFLFENVLD